MQDKLKVAPGERKKGSTVKVLWDKESIQSFEDTKRALCQALSLQNVRVDQPFVLRVDASGKAVGAALEQVPNGVEAKTIDDVLKHTRKDRPNCLHVEKTDRITDEDMGHP